MILQIHTTCKDEDEARRIANAMLQKKLVACANYFPVKSIYWWKGKIENDSEIMLVLKTNEKKKDEAISEIKNIHLYELPVITVQKVDSNIDTCNWIDDIIKK